jgi:hypothetical protein
MVPVMACAKTVMLPFRVGGVKPRAGDAAIPQARVGERGRSAFCGYPGNRSVVTAEDGQFRRRRAFFSLYLQSLRTLAPNLAERLPGLKKVSAEVNHEEDGTDVMQRPRNYRLALILK